MKLNRKRENKREKKVGKGISGRCENVVTRNYDYSGVFLCVFDWLLMLNNDTPSVSGRFPNTGTRF